MSRPEILFPLFADLPTLPGVGPKTAEHFDGLGVQKPRDLLFTLPTGVVDRRMRETVKGMDFPTVATVEVSIGAHTPPHQKGRPYRITVHDSEISFQVVFFHARADYLKRALPTGQRRIISGKMEIFDNVPQMVHPDHILDPAAAQSIPEFEPIYPLTHGVTQKVMTKAANGALTLAPDLPEWIDPDL